MKIKVKLFASFRQITGKSELNIELAEGSTVAGLLSDLIKAHPKIEAISHNSLVSINLNYGPFDTVLRDGDEVAFIPPVSGG